MSKNFLKRYIGDKKFYEMTFAIALPMIIQNGVTNFVSLLDNIMVGQIGTEPMSGVSIVNQLLFVYRLALFGALAGAGIFGAQYYGAGDNEGLRYTMRFKIIIGSLITAIGLLILSLGGSFLVGRFLLGEADVGNMDLTMTHAMDYLHIMFLEMIPFMIVQIYSSSLRETGETLVPMKASFIAILINLVGNYLLIFGKFFFPALGVSGAAIATFISRCVECAIIVSWTHRNTSKYPFLVGLFKNFRIPGSLARNILTKSLPLTCNELFWSMGITMTNQCYTLRGLSAVAAMNIATTINNVFSIVFISMGSVVGIIMGQILGTGNFEHAKDYNRKLTAFSLFLSMLTGGIMALFSPLFPAFYETDALVKQLASRIILVFAICMPLDAYMNATYFTLRAGGNVLITIIFDCVFVWITNLPAAFLLSHYTSLGIVPMFAIVSLLSIIKCLIGFILVRKGGWLRNIAKST